MERWKHHMPDLSFAIEGIDAVPDTSTPFLRARLRITNSCSGEPIRSIALRCQIQIQPARRRYSDEEKEALGDLFGSPDRWSSTVRPLSWANTQTSVPPFLDTTIAEIRISAPCDLNLPAANYLHAVREGEIPVVFLFSGTVFYAADNDTVQIAQIRWDCEATYRAPVGLCKQVMGFSRGMSACASLDPTVQDYLRRWRAENVAVAPRRVEKLLRTAFGGATSPGAK